MKRYAFALAACSVPVIASAAPPPDAAATRALFEHTIAVPTVLGLGRVPELARYLADQFRQAGWRNDDVSVVPYHTASPDESGPDETAAVIVRWRSARAPKQRPILVMGHMDVVAAHRDEFTTDPFVLAERDGYFYGRGTVYMKAGLVAVVRAMIELRASGFRPARDITLFFTGDEESHGLGAERGATAWRERLGYPEYGLNADGLGVLVSDAGTALGASISTAEKGYADYNLTVRNRGGHSSMPRADNAIYALAHALERIEAHRFAPVLNDTTRAYFAARRNSAPAVLAEAIDRWLKDPRDGAAADAVEATETETGLTRTRCVATMMRGGHASNALPELATALINCRLFPEADPDGLRDELERVVSDPDVVVTRNDSYPGTVTSPLRTDVVAAFTKAVRAIHPGAPVYPSIATGATDARTFRRAGVPVYGVSAQWLRVPIDMRVNQRDERIPTASLYDGVRHWKIMLAELAGK